MLLGENGDDGDAGAVFVGGGDAAVSDPVVLLLVVVVMGAEEDDGDAAPSDDDDGERYGLLPNSLRDEEDAFEEQTKRLRR